MSDEDAVLESEPASLGLGPVFDVKFIEDTARMVAVDDTNCLQVRDLRLYYDRAITLKMIRDCIGHP